MSIWGYLLDHGQLLRGYTPEEKQLSLLEATNCQKLLNYSGSSFAILHSYWNNVKLCSVMR